MILIHLSVDGHLGGYQILAIGKYSADNMERQTSLQDPTLSLLDICPEVGSLDHMVVV